MTLPDPTGYGFGGITLIVALYIVLQALKRQYRALQYWMPLIVLGLAAALVAAFMWAQTVFLFLGATIVVAALVFSSHGVMKNVAGGSGDKDKAA